MSRVYCCWKSTISPPVYKLEKMACNQLTLIVRDIVSKTNG